MNDQSYMMLALDEARKAAGRGEVPIGAVIVHRDTVIASAGNRIEQDQDPSSHAELLAIREAVRALGDRRLENCTLYVTLEPCAMCSGAIVNARLPRVVFAAHDPKAGAVQSLYQLLNDSRLNHRCEVSSGICAEESSALLREFFQQLRESRKESAKNE